MRVAVCLSGQPRYIEQCAPLVRKHLIEPNSADVFVHTWFDESRVGSLYDTSQPHQANIVGYVDPRTLEHLGTLGARVLQTEPQRSFEHHEKVLRGAPSAKVSSVCSNFYSQWRVNSIFRKWARENSQEYDVIVRARIDLWYGGDIVIDNICRDFSSELVLASVWQNKRETFIPGLGDYTMDDNIVISSPENIDKYCQVFPNMITLNSQIDPPFAENYLGWHCKKSHNMRVVTERLPVEIMHRIIYNTPSQE